MAAGYGRKGKDMEMNTAIITKERTLHNELRFSNYKTFKPF